MITKKPYTDLIKNPTKPTKTKLLEKDKVKLSKKPIKTILPKKPIKVLDNKKKTSVNKSEIKSSTKSANTKTRGKSDLIVSTYIFSSVFIIQFIEWLIKS